MDSARGMAVLRRRKEMQRQTCLEEDSENACDRGRVTMCFHHQSVLFVTVALGEEYKLLVEFTPLSRSYSMPCVC